MEFKGEQKGGGIMFILLAADQNGQTRKEQVQHGTAAWPEGLCHKPFPKVHDMGQVRDKA